MKTVTVKVTEEQYARLAAEARAGNVSKSEVIRRSLEKRESGGAQATLLERMGDLVGSVEGPADLSVNEAKMHDYGRSRADRHRASGRRP